MPKWRPGLFRRRRPHCFSIELGKKLHRRSTVKTADWKLHQERMGRPAESVDTRQAGTHEHVVEIIAAYLEWSRKERESRTHDWYKGRYTRPRGL